MRQRFREWRTQHFNDWTPLYAQISRVSAVAWDLTRTLALAGLLILLLLVLLLMLRDLRPVQSLLMAVFPDRIVAMLSAPRDQPEPAAGAHQKSALRRHLDKALVEVGPPQPQPKHSAYLTLGATKREVLAIQGVPTRTTEAVWYYGRSEVYFAGDRVVGWSVAAGHPLKVPVPQ